MCRILLACLGKPVAMTAREQSPGTIELGDAATATRSVCRNRTHKPGPLSTEPVNGVHSMVTHCSTSLQSSP